MRIVMPEILPHSAAEPYLAMARFETGEGGNPHFHGFSIGAGGPQLGRFDADMDREVIGDVAPESSDEDGANADAQLVSGDERIVEGPVAVDDQFVDVGLSALVQDEDGASPDVDPFESDAEEKEVDVRPDTVIGDSGAVPPVPVPSTEFVRPARKKMKVKRKLLPQTSAASFPDVLYEQGGHKQQRSEMECVFSRYFGDLVSECNPCFDEHGNARCVWDNAMCAHEVGVGDLRAV